MVWMVWMVDVDVEVDVGVDPCDCDMKVHVLLFRLTYVNVHLPMFFTYSVRLM